MDPVAVEPQWPVAITRMAVRHSWASYTGAMNGVIRHGGWQTPLAMLEAAGVPVLLADGADDPVPVPGRIDDVAGSYGNVTAATHATAGHQLPITHPSWCVNRLTEPGEHGHDAARRRDRRLRGSYRTGPQATRAPESPVASVIASASGS